MNKIESHREQDDTQLLLLVRRNDVEAFEVLYNRFWERLFIAANRILEDEEASKDILQEIFIDIWNRRNSLEIQNLNAFLYKAVKFQIAKELRKRPINPIHLEMIADIKSTYSTEDAVILSDLNEQIEQVIVALPPRCQEIFRLSRFENLSNKEIAQRLNISLSTVENQIHIALKSLHSNLDNTLSFLLLCYWLDSAASSQLITVYYH